MKIQFIIVGWHFDKFPDTVKKLYELNIPLTVKEALKIQNEIRIFMMAFFFF